MSAARVKRPAAEESVPSAPQTTPATPDWGHERDAGHLWTAITGLKEKSGELSAAIAGTVKVVEDLRSEIKEIDNGINDLKTEQKATAKTVKVVGLVATPLIAVVAFVAPMFWNNSMRPELERSIAAQVKADIEKEQAAREKTRQLEQEIADLKAKLQAKTAK